MPPSMTTYLRMPGSVFKMPTVYSVTPAGATSERPGSTRRRGNGRLCSAHKSRTAEQVTSAKSSMEEG